MRKLLAVALLALCCSSIVFARMGRGGGLTVGFLPAGHWVAAQLPMTVIFPRPDSETSSYARHHWFYWDGSNPVQGRIPIEVQGGAYPYVFQLLSGPPGSSIQQTYWVPGDTPAQMLAAGYGEFIWTPTAPWTGTISVRVTGQDQSSVVVSFTASTVGAYSSSSFAGTATVNGTTSITVNTVTSGTLSYGTVLTGTDIPANDYVVGQVSGTTGGPGVYTLAQAATGSVGPESVTGSLKAGFLFIDATCSSCDSTGSGTITSPWQTLNKVYGLTSPIISPSGSTTYPGAILYLRGNSSATDYEAYDQTGGGGTYPGITLSRSRNPIAILGFPGDPLPDIDITNLSANVSAHSSVFNSYADGSDTFLQNLEFSGQADGGSSSGPQYFSYFSDGYVSNRLTFENIDVPNAWTGVGTGSGNSSTITLNNPGGTTVRSYTVMRGITEDNRPAGPNLSLGVYVIFNSDYVVSEFNSFQAATGTSGGSSAYGVKQGGSYVTNRYDYSTGNFNYLFWRGGYYVTGDAPNSYIEDCYNTIVNLASTPGTPTLVYNQSNETTENTYAYRNSIVNSSAGVSQPSTTGQGPFWFSSNAIQFSGNAQAILLSSGSSWSGGALPSNVTDTTAGTCEASSGIFNASNQLTGTCAASYLGEIGAQIQ